VDNGGSDAQRAHSAHRKDEGSSGDSRGDEEDLPDTQQNEETPRADRAWASKLEYNAAPKRTS
jgi:hypothetical protein